MSSTLESIWYVYGIVPGSAEFTNGALPDGLDDAGVSVERRGDLAALVSVLDGASYAPTRVEQSSGDVEWLSPRATAHDRVLSWASDRGAVVPLPMFSLFSGRDAVRAMLDDRSAQLSSALERVKRGREYALRVYRIDAELLEVIPEMSPRLRELAAQAASASPGQRYLLERKLDGEKRAELRSVTQQFVDDIVEQLGRNAAETVRSPIPRAADRTPATGTMVLNAAFLVAPSALEAFQRTLTSIVERHDQRGFRFDFTGPWPPYHFAHPSTADDGD
ncbi:MAG TPA: GvpL/GvpF family gas vesicle protein [Gemmatimonadaceae bacterium]|nr:GvpL/GvpF family gas vesicle protein [Gemmatimonadaceae bacterium]